MWKMGATEETVPSKMQYLKREYCILDAWGQDGIGNGKNENLAAKITESRQDF